MSTGTGAGDGEPSNRKSVQGPERLRPGARCRVRSPGGAVVAAGRERGSPGVRELAAGTLVVCAEVDPSAEEPDRIRIASPAGWVDAACLEPVGKAPSLRLDRETFLARHLEPGPGDFYGLEFPISLAALREAGPDFLTEAFHAARTLPTDNRVARIVRLEPLGHPGASDAAFLTLEYAVRDPALHTELFVKVSPTNLDRKAVVAAMAHGEVTMNRRSVEGLLPVPVARYYFGDYCSQTSNFLLITERVAFGEGGIEPAWTKGYDHLVPEVEAHYRVLAESLARVVAAHKKGTMGDDLERDFPFPRAARRFAPIDRPEVKVDWLIDFIGRVAPRLFAPAATGPAFLERWREDVLFGLAHDKAIVEYLHADVDYTGLCHPNLNLDNAWFWRTQSGELRAGWLDLGGFGQMSIAQALSCMSMMCEPERYAVLERKVIAAFVRALEREGGPSLDPEVLRLQQRASVLSVSLGMILAAPDQLLSPFSADEYASMESWHDPRLQETGLAVAIIWIDVVLRQWLDDPTPGDAWRRIVARGPGRAGGAGSSSICTDGPAAPVR